MQVRDREGIGGQMQRLQIKPRPLPGCFIPGIFSKKISGLCLNRCQETLVSADIGVILGMIYIEERYLIIGAY